MNTGAGSRYDRPVTLYDGQVVSSYSEAWRAECEARHVLRMGAKEERQAYLALVDEKRGTAAAERLRDLVMKIWRARRGPAAA